MPMNFTQLGALVDRARQKPPPVVSAPPVRRVDPARKAAAPSTPPVPAKPSQVAMRMQKAASVPSAPSASTPAAAVSPLPQSECTTEADDFPIGWELSKESWYFHRRFFRRFRRPMHRGEYSHLLYQIRHRRAEFLAEGCWRVRLPDGKTLVVRGDRWRLANILPRDWQPPNPAATPAA